MNSSEEEGDICTQDEKKYVNELVKAILVLDHSKKPFKQADLSKYLSKKPGRKQWDTILEKCKMKLGEMGFTLVETKNAITKSFFLISNMFPLPSEYQLACESEVADRTLLILVLAFIFMKKGSVRNVDLFKHLEQLGIYKEEKQMHDYFGDVKTKILNEFVSQLYIEKIVDTELETTELKWGERALAEVTKRSILEFVCQIGYGGKMNPKNFTSFYKAVLKEEKGKTQNEDDQSEDGQNEGGQSDDSESEDSLYEGGQNKGSQKENRQKEDGQNKDNQKENGQNENNPSEDSLSEDSESEDSQYEGGHNKDSQKENGQNENNPSEDSLSEDSESEDSLYEGGQNKGSQKENRQKEDGQNKDNQKENGQNENNPSEDSLSEDSLYEGGQNKGSQKENRQSEDGQKEDRQNEMMIVDD